MIKRGPVFVVLAHSESVSDVDFSAQLVGQKMTKNRVSLYLIELFFVSASLQYNVATN